MVAGFGYKGQGMERDPPCAKLLSAIVLRVFGLQIFETTKKMRLLQLADLNMSSRYRHSRNSQPNMKGTHAVKFPKVF